MYILLLVVEAYIASVKSNWLKIFFRSYISLLIFGLLISYERGVLKTQNAIMNLSLSPLSFIDCIFMHFEALWLDANTFKLWYLLGEMIPLSL